MTSGRFVEDHRERGQRTARSDSSGIRAGIRYARKGEFVHIAGKLSLRLFWFPRQNH